MGDLLTSLLCRSMILIAKILGPRLFHVIEGPFLNRKGTTKKDAVCFLLKRAGVQTPQDPPGCTPSSILKLDVERKT